MAKKSLLSIFLLFIVSCSDNSISLQSFEGKTMGTTYSVKFLSDEKKINLNNIQKAVDSALVEVNNQMSTYQKDSEISLFNELKDTSEFNISDAFLMNIEEALKICRQTEGAYDISVGPLVNIWGFGPQREPGEIPSEFEIIEAKNKVGYNYIEVSHSNKSIRKLIPDLYIDLSSIAKGYGVDVSGKILEEMGIFNYLIEIGGEVRARGLNHEGKFWKVGISTPDGSFSIQKVLEMNNISVATSGDYRNYFKKNGKQFSHLIDPRTGYPIQHSLTSVSIIEKECYLADGYATAISILGPEEGLKFANKNNIAAYMIKRENEMFVEVISDKFKEYLENKNYE